MNGSRVGLSVATIVALFLGACAERPLSQTAVDATHMGFKPTQCTGSTATTVYVTADAVDRDAACSAVETALAAAERAGAVTPALVRDSILLAVVWRFPLARTPSRTPAPDSGQQVTVDFSSRAENLIVEWPATEGQLRVGWGPEGLRY